MNNANDSPRELDALIKDSTAAVPGGAPSLPRAEILQFFRIIDGQGIPIPPHSYSTLPRKHSTNAMS